VKGVLGVFAAGDGILDFDFGELSRAGLPICDCRVRARRQAPLIQNPKSQIQILNFGPCGAASTEGWDRNLDGLRSIRIVVPSRHGAIRCATRQTAP
jgi:hypothetical protein